ncbi:hypothetical protein AAMO2058_000486400 [Amorphochlora amoebiformis]
MALRSVLFTIAALWSMYGRPRSSLCISQEKFLRKMNWAAAPKPKPKEDISVAEIEISQHMKEGDEMVDWHYQQREKSPARKDKLRRVEEDIGRVRDGQFMLFEEIESEEQNVEIHLPSKRNSDLFSDMFGARYGLDGSPRVWTATISVQGTTHKQNEDRYLPPRYVSGLGTVFGVFDGHRGNTCSEFISSRLSDALTFSWRNTFSQEELKESMPNPTLTSTPFNN